MSKKHIDYSTEEKQEEFIALVSEDQDKIVQKSQHMAESEIPNRERAINNKQIARMIGSQLLEHPDCEDVDLSRTFDRINDTDEILGIVDLSWAVDLKDYSFSAYTENKRFKRNGWSQRSVPRGIARSMLKGYGMRAKKYNKLAVKAGKKAETEYEQINSI